jgi:serine/threonine-protein kinase
MGLVYRALDRNLDRQVAIKTLTEGFVQDPEMLQRFYREAKKTGVLKHPNIVTVYDLGEQDGVPYIVMEYVAGDPLDKLIESSSSMPLITKLKIMEQVCSALGYAHRNDVIHRDVKPANIIVQPDGTAKLLDFGIAHHERQERDLSLTRTGNVIGTVQYMAPERLKGGKFDGRSDLFSAGVVLYQLLSGRMPFPVEDGAFIRRLLEEDPPSLSNYLAEYPAALDGIIARSLAKEPRDRYRCAEDVAAELAGVAEELKKRQAGELFRQAENRVAAGEYAEARDVLYELVKLDTKHTGARKLMAQVEQYLAAQGRAEQVRQLRARAERAVEEKDYPQALACVEEAQGLDPSNAELAAMTGELRRKKRTREQVDSYLKLADVAREAGSLEEAQAILQKALQLDKEDSRLRAAWSTLALRIEEASRRAKVRKLMESAKAESASLRFERAIELLREAERIDPSNAELISLLSAAKAGQEQQQRRRELERIQNQVSLAVTPEELVRARDLVNKSIECLPGEPQLLRLKAQLDRQVREIEIQRQVDEAVRRCRSTVETSPQKALEFVLDGLGRFPNSDRLLRLRAELERQVQQAKLEETRTRYMTQAHSALDKGQYLDATRILEKCRAEGIYSNEITELLDFARHEADRQDRQSMVENNQRRAQELIASGAYDQAIELLEPVVARVQDAALSGLLEKAKSEQVGLQQRLQRVLEECDALMRQEEYDQAVSFIEQQPSTMQQTPRVRAALMAAREAKDQEQLVLQAAGKAYAALESGNLDLGAEALKLLRDCRPEPRLLPDLLERYGKRRAHLAEKSVLQAIASAQTALEGGQAKDALERLEQVQPLLKHASIEVQKNWEEMNRKAGRAKVLAVFGIRRPA